MKMIPNSKSFALSGKFRYKVKSIIAIYRSTIVVSLQRFFRGPLLPGWTWSFEVATHLLRYQMVTAFNMKDTTESREYENSLVFHSPALEKVTVEPVAVPVKGDWYRTGKEARVTVLYLHGGGYAFYAHAHYNLISCVTLATRAQTFALDYRLIPEHPYPAQLEDALAAYRWLLASGIPNNKIVIAGDSAGGNLVLALLLTLRDTNQPAPLAGICLCPWTDVANSGESMTANEKYDWVQKAMADQWSKWLCNGTDVMNPIISPLYANLTGLPPIYIQAGGAEILHDMIVDFTNEAKKQNANVKLDVWPTMNHDFQAFGEIVPESAEALQRMGAFIDDCIKG